MNWPACRNTTGINKSALKLSVHTSSHTVEHLWGQILNMIICIWPHMPTYSRRMTQGSTAWIFDQVPEATSSPSAEITAWNTTC